jgi:hypothetical protein
MGWALRILQIPGGPLTAHTGLSGWLYSDVVLNSNFTSIVESSPDGSYVHVLTAFASASTNIGLPPNSVTMTTDPFGLTVATTLATPEIFNRRANAGYSGGAPDFNLRSMAPVNVKVPSVDTLAELITPIHISDKKKTTSETRGR